MKLNKKVMMLSKLSRYHVNCVKQITKNYLDKMQAWQEQANEDDLSNSMQTKIVGASICTIIDSCIIKEKQQLFLKDLRSMLRK